MISATYSPEDNKIRLYPSARLDADLYARVREAGFIWAPKQKIFVAPMWTPAREDIALELAGEIGDEDKTLAERAEERAERFEEYSDKRAAEAESAKKAVSQIAGGIPMGQPILIGHHSERRARKDAERIENGMRKAVNMWETAKYWQYRAEGALAHARYKERPDVRARRIKGIEADLRKAEKSKTKYAEAIAFWSKDGLTLEEAIVYAGSSDTRFTLPRKEGDRPDFNQAPDAYSALTNSYPNLYAPRTLEEVKEAALKRFPRLIAHYERWINHYQNRLSYERAILGEELGGGDFSDKWAHIVAGGRVLCRGEWATVLKVNKRGGKACSVRTNARFVSMRNVEEIQDYEPPSAEVAELAKENAKLPPLCNYPGEGFHHMTSAEYKRQYADNRGTLEAGQGAKNRWDRVVSGAPENVGRHRVRVLFRFSGSRSETRGVYLTDAKETVPPRIEDGMSARPVLPPPAKDLTPAKPYEPPKATEFDAIKETLKAGVQVVSANQLFPTPPELAARVVELAEIAPGMRVLEPSAGTGNILEKIPSDCAVVAVEINATLGGQLDATNRAVVIGDFLACNAETLWGAFDRVLMNPPFENGADIKHILHALGFLKDGGRLVAICANGPRQNEQLKPLASEWYELPAGTFAGTNVRAALLVIEG